MKIIIEPLSKLMITLIVGYGIYLSYDAFRLTLINLRYAEK